MYQGERERSRDRRQVKHHRSSSQDSNQRRRHKHKDNKQNKPKSKRVKFQEEHDIKYFRREDEPSAKGLSQDDILKLKNQIEKQVSRQFDFQDFKHRDAKSQSNSMKEQREKEKAWNDKLMAVRQSIIYYLPYKLSNVRHQYGNPGSESEQKKVHSNRIREVLGCYYTHASQIPNEPQFEIINTGIASQPKIIKFDNDNNSYDNSVSKKQESIKPLKGILKMTIQKPQRKSQPRSIDPALVTILRNLKQNSNYYSKQVTQKLLKPFRQSGQLQFLTKNKQLLQRLLRDSTPSIPPPIQSFNSFQSRQSNQRSSIPKSQNNFQQQQHQFVPKADKFRTVPCKPQGCTKITNCSFIHDQRYPGVPVPNVPLGPMNIIPQSQLGISRPPVNFPQNNPPPPPSNYPNPMSSSSGNNVPPPPSNNPMRNPSNNIYIIDFGGNLPQPSYPMPNAQNFFPPPSSNNYQMPGNYPRPSPPPHNYPNSNDYSMNHMNQNQINHMNQGQMSHMNSNQMSHINPNQMNQMNQNQMNQNQMNQKNQTQMNQIAHNQMNQMNQKNPNQMNQMNQMNQINHMGQQMNHMAGQQQMNSMGQGQMGNGYPVGNPNYQYYIPKGQGK